MAKKQATPRSGPPIEDPYGDWLQRLIAEDPSRLSLLGMVPPLDPPPKDLPVLYRPVLLKWQGSVEQFADAFGFRRAFSSESPFVIDPFQLEMLPNIVERTGSFQALIHQKIHPERAEISNDQATILCTWPPVAWLAVAALANAGSAVSFAGANPFAEGPKPGQKGTAIGIVDDGIGFLNERFMRRGDDGAMRSRFEALWFQSVLPPQGPAYGTLPTIGALVDRLKAESEADVYRDIAARVYAPGTSHRLNRLTSHGTHMLDLAAGEDPYMGATEIDEVPLLGVQIPPQAYDDTSGKILEPHLVTGIHWLWFTAWLLGYERLIVNVSLGILAGPKDGTGCVERQIDAAIALAQLFGVTLEVSLAYGNFYESRLVSVFRFPAEEEENTVDIIMQPDDLTAGHVEIRGIGKFEGPEIEDANIWDIRLTLLHPDGQTTDFSAADGQKDIVSNGVTHGSIALVTPLSGDPYIQIRFSPTRQNPSADAPLTLLCAPGNWSLRATCDAKAWFSVQIQRDDQIVDTRKGARQAYFDHPGAHAHSSRNGDYTQLHPGCPITHEGTQSAYTTGQKSTTVGAATVRRMEDGGYFFCPAPYASEGAAWSARPTPAKSALSEIAANIPGVTASGTFTGSTARLSGSSTASATWVRSRLVDTGGFGGGAAKAPTVPGQYSRLGQETVLDNRSIRRRP